VTRRTTLMDVAQRAGVSRTTASFVLAGRRDMRISPDTEQRVIQAARELDYRPNLLARSLRTNLSQTVGLISDTIASDVFAGNMIRSSLVTALNNDHLLFVGESEGDEAVETQLIQSMLDRGVSGFIYASMFTREVRLNPLLVNRPLVLLNCVTQDAPVSSVVPAELQGGRAAVRALLEHAHRDSIYLVGETPDDVIAGRERLVGIREELAAAGVELAGQVPSRWWPEPSYEAVSKLLATEAAPTAFICMNDRVAMGTYQACHDAGLVIPRDVSVVSFDNSDLASWCRPQMTSVALPHLEMGRRAVELLLQPEPVPQTHLVEMPLVMRESVTTPRTRQHELV
jgi:LacI family transcriptional regulator